MRYRGPVHRVARRLGVSILENNKEFSKGKKRRTPPGMHTVAKKNLKGYALQLAEKQKIMYIYGLNNRQLKNVYKKAITMKGSSSNNFINLIESRLDNLVFRMGVVPTRKAARQLVTHGHILVNGKKCDIASAVIKPDSIIKLREKSRALPIITKTLEEQVATLPFVSFDKNTFEGTYIRFPERSELSNDFNEGLVIEFFNR